MDACSFDTIAPSKESLRQIAARVYKEFDGDVDKAISEVLRQIYKDKYLKARILEEAVGEAVHSLVTSAMRHERLEILRRPVAPQSFDIGGAARRSTTLCQKIYMDFTLAGGVRLRNATFEQLSAQVEFYEKQGSTMLKLGRWLRSIILLLPPGKTVGKALSESKLHQLYDEA